MWAVYWVAWILRSLFRCDPW